MAASASLEMNALLTIEASSAGTLTIVPSGPMHLCAKAAIARAMLPDVVISLMSLVYCISLPGGQLFLVSGGVASKHKSAPTRW
jgi:hypothetical protein